jgi:hypothetical protein
MRPAVDKLLVPEIVVEGDDGATEGLATDPYSTFIGQLEWPYAVARGAG